MGNGMDYIYSAGDQQILKDIFRLFWKNNPEKTK